MNRNLTLAYWALRFGFRALAYRRLIVAAKWARSERKFSKWSRIMRAARLVGQCHGR